MDQKNMKWTIESEEAIKKVPFFVRKKVKARVEKEASLENKHEITIKEVESTQKRFLSNMSSEIKGYQLDNCFGAGGCPNRAVSGEDLRKRLEELLEDEKILGFLKENVKGSLKFHHEFRISIAECPNSCSQPQIKDIGIIGALLPEISDEPCTMCGICVKVCKENAVTLLEEKEEPEIDFSNCLACGKCIKVCSSKTIQEGKKGFRILLGGKLGRHPKLGVELDGIFSEYEVLAIVKKCIAYYKAESKNGKRFAELIYNTSTKELTDLFT